MNARVPCSVRTVVLASALGVVPALCSCAPGSGRSSPNDSLSRVEVRDNDAARREWNAASIHYLEIVTPKVEETCGVLARIYDVRFGDPVAEAGNARTANLKDGGRIGVRAPMHAGESAVVRPYVLVQDVEAAVREAEASGGIVIVPPMPIGEQGVIAIYVLGGIEHGLWQR